MAQTIASTTARLTCEQRRWQLTGGNGVNVVYDPVAGDLYEPSFRSLDWGGRYLTIGYAGGAIPKIPANQLLVKNRAALGFALFYYRKRRPDLLAKSAAQLMDWYSTGKIRPAYCRAV